MPKNIRAEVIEYLKDGSALIEVPAKEHWRLVGKLRLRQVRARGVGRDGKLFELRLWTTLLDENRYGAEALARNYAERWEQELYFRGLKLDVRSSALLCSHTVETALQEIAAVVLASAVIARLRVEAGNELKVPPSRVSFLKLMVATEELWVTERALGETLTEEQRRRIRSQYFEDVRRWAVLPERRPRSCPHAVRQPVTGWPRKTDQRSYTGEVEITVVRS